MKGNSIMYLHVGVPILFVSTRWDEFCAQQVDQDHNGKWGWDIAKRLENPYVLDTRLYMCLLIFFRCFMCMLVLRSNEEWNPAGCATQGSFQECPSTSGLWCVPEADPGGSVGLWVHKLWFRTCSQCRGRDQCFRCWTFLWNPYKKDACN